ncbi:RZZ complex, subunit zwilch domain-containing protein [Ditylenchus destructor]|nr:RZZ complex, subunit zwilch domain-containing protein [Ditylenchus destructor]
MNQTTGKRSQLVTEEGVVLQNRYRARLVNTEGVPVLCHLQSIIGNEIILIDLPQAEGYEARILALEKDRSEKSFRGNDVDMSEEDKENIPEDCTLVGEPLKVSFLTLDKLNKLAGAKGALFTDYETTLSVDRHNLAAHLMGSQEALQFTHKLSNNENCSELHDPILDNLCRFVLADASSSQQFLFGGRQKTNKLVTSFRATYLGNLKSASCKLRQMSLQIQRTFNLRESKFRCRFDVLSDFVERLPEFIAASFVIQTEWTGNMANLKGRTTGKNDAYNDTDFLEMPPDTARAIIKFKPGWLDRRVDLFERIQELRYLKSLALALKAGVVPLTKDDEDSTLVLQQVANLIESAKLGKDPEIVQFFTDRLWNAMKISRSIQTVQKCFEMLHSEMKMSSFKVMVESTKMSSLAKMLRMHNPADMIFYRLEPLTCLQMLVEIGVDCFNGDLRHRFSTHNFLPNGTDLEPFFASPTSNLEDQIERLIPIHLALQSILKISEFVRLVSHEQTVITKQLLEHFTTAEGINPCTKEFTYKVKMEDIFKDKLKGSISEWVVHKFLERPVGIGCMESPNSGFVHDITHISKGTGFKLVAPISCTKTADISNPQPEAMDTTTKEESIKLSDKTLIDESLFDCVHLSISSHPANLFYQN